LKPRILPASWIIYGGPSFLQPDSTHIPVFEQPNPARAATTSRDVTSYL